MRTLYLRADTEAAMIAALQGLIPGFEGGSFYNHSLALDWGIPVVAVPAVIEDGEVVTPAEMDPRCHVNLRVMDDRDVPESLLVHPETPQRAWA